MFYNWIMWEITSLVYSNHVEVKFNDSSAPTQYTNESKAMKWALIPG